MFDVQYILLQIKYLEGVIRTSEATIADLEAESVRVTKVRRVPTGGTTLSLNIQNFNFTQTQGKKYKTFDLKIFFLKLGEERNKIKDKIYKFETESVIVFQDCEEKQLRWEHREVELERTLQRMENQAQQIAGAASKVSFGP